MPDTVHGIIAARLDTLPPTESLAPGRGRCGRRCSGRARSSDGRRGTTTTSAPHSTSWPGRSSLRPARLSSVEGEAEYVFWHALIRDVAYGQIPRAAASHQAHRRCASGSRRSPATRLADQAELIAHHTSEALAIARAAGERRHPELEARAARFLVLAGDRALELDVGGSGGALSPRRWSCSPRATEEHGLRRS